MRLCKNGCDLPTYGKRAICKECIRIENRENWNKNKKYYNKKRSNTKQKRNCKVCNREFETAIKTKVYCSEKCKQEYNYSTRTLFQISRAKALIAIQDKGKKKISGVRYTKKEINLIVQKYRVWTDVKIAEKLDRTVRGVRSKIKRLKNDGIIYDTTGF